MPRISPSARDLDFAARPLGQAEVGDVRLAGGIDQDVARLEIAMHDARLVGEVQGVADGGQQLGRLALRQPLGVFELGQRDALDQVADDIDVVAVAADLVHADDMRMPQLRRDAGFVQKLFHLAGAQLPAPRNLQGHRAVELAYRGPSRPCQSRPSPAAAAARNGRSA